MKNLIEDMERLLKEHSKETVRFISYFKFGFTYGNKDIRIHVGGDSADIYRADLKYEMTIEDLLKETGTQYASWELV